MPGYAKQRTNWQDFPATSTPITAANLNGLETAIYDLKYLSYNVKDYGAVGDGSADDSTPISDAITAATNGGIVFFPPGNYKLTSSITLPRVTQKGLILRGAGREASRVTFTGAGHAFVIGGTTNADAAYGQWIEDLTIQCSFVSGAIIGAVNFRAATWCGLRRLRINGANLGSQIHAQFEGGSYFSFFNTVEGCDFRGIDQPTDIGIKLVSTTADGANANWIRGNYFSIYKYAVQVASGDENWVSENHFNGSVTTAVRVDSSGTGNANGNLILANHFDGPTNGVDLASGAVDTYVNANYGSATYANAGTNTRVGNNQPQAWSGVGSYADYQSVASATTIAIPDNADTCLITGTTTITSITAKRAGTRVTLVFAGILTFTDGSNLKLAGNFVTTADDSINLVCDGTNWFEISRSVN